MKRVLFILGCLLLACPALFADSKSGFKDTADKTIVVDPLDLRQPVPDPERELTQKYDGKTVRFTGVLQSFGTENDKKTHWYDLAVDTAKRKDKATAKKETGQVVVVRVYFRTDEKRLRSLQTKPALTVEGTGSIMQDGSLVIRGAIIVDGKIETQPTKR
jgi:hypothetical protein